MITALVEKRKRVENYVKLMYNIIRLSLVPGAIKGTSYTILLRISNYYGGIL